MQQRGKNISSATHHIRTQLLDCIPVLLSFDLPLLHLRPRVRQGGLLGVEIMLQLGTLVALRLTHSTWIL